jgi:MraZ protein
LLFTGTFEHAIDAKQRLAIPSEVRDRINPEADGEALYAMIGQGLPIAVTDDGEQQTGSGSKALCLYTERGFEQRAEQLDHSELPSDDVLMYERMMFPLARRVDLDKQGRVRLPETLLKLAELDKDVVLIGVKDHLEIHDRARWNAYLTQMLNQRPELLRNPRQLMK